LKYLALAVLLIFSLVDAFFNKDILLWSANLSFFFQDKGGDIVHIVGMALSSGFTFWVPAVVVLYNHLSNNSKDSLYHFTKYFLAIDLGVLFKILFYQGRPYLASEKIDGCTCDPGMPSGHSIMAISGYYMIYVIFTERLEFFSPVKHVGRVMILKVFCVLLAAGIIWSRIALGAHSVDQLFIGSMIAINVILWYDKKVFDSFYDYLEKKSHAFSLAVSLFMIALGVGFLFINHEYREDYDFLKYYNKCEVCKGTMVVSQSLNAAICQILPGALIQYPYTHKKALLEAFENQKVFENRWPRFWFFCLVVIIIPGVFMGIGQLLLVYVLDGIYSSSLFLILFAGPLAFYLGWAITFFSETTYKYFNQNALTQPLLQETDNIHRSTFSSPGDKETEDSETPSPESTDKRRTNEA
jgi:membrane-associated phospholipid phosphatase